MENLYLTVSFEDPELIYSTLFEYAAAVERGEMSTEEAGQNIAALAIGMMHFGESKGS